MNPIWNIPLRLRRTPWAGGTKLALRLRLAVLSIAAAGLSCEESSLPANNIDEAGVWSLTHFRLAEDASFRPVREEAKDGFLLEFDPEKGIVRAAACSSDSHAPDVRKSTCEANDKDDLNWECSCFHYQFNGGTMLWEEFKSAPVAQARTTYRGRRFAVSVYHPESKPSAAVFLGLPNASDDEDGGLFQSDGKSSRHQFNHRDSSPFERSGCVHACR